MVGHGQKLGRQKEAAITAFPTHRNADEAAQAVGVGATTLWRWLKLPEFQAEHRKARRDAFSQSIARLQQGCSAAATTMLKIMLDQNAPASTRVRAAECVMNQATKAIEIEDIEARVSDLEHSPHADWRPVGH
jgi:hypothetical protein